VASKRLDASLRFTFRIASRAAAVLDIIKYFFEEPTSLEPLTPDDDPDARRMLGPTGSLEALLAGASYHRGYLAGTNMTSGRVGLTALSSPAAFIEPIVRWMASRTMIVAGKAEKQPQRILIDDVGEILHDPSGIRVLAAGEGMPQPALLIGSSAEPRRHAVPAIRALLDEGFDLLFPEPAHSGFDWSIFSSRPIKHKLTALLREHHDPGKSRTFILPYQRARSEERFYFEQWALNGNLPDYIEEL